MSLATPGDQADPELIVTNEFTSVKVRKARTRNGEVLEIESLRLERVVRLDALILESLTWRSEEDLARGLETPFGHGPDQPPPSPGQPSA
jgi:hypothetical protein